MSEDLVNQQKFFPATGMPDPDWWQALWPDPLDVLKKVGVKSGMKAVDLCCGDGLFTAPMSTILGGQVIAVDLDPEILVIGERLIKEVGAPDCTWIVGDARDLPKLIPEKVDIVLLANTFHGVPEQTRLAESVSGILISGGRFIIINWHVLPREETTVLGKPRGPRTDMRMSPDEVSIVVEASGLCLEKIVELPPYHYGAVFKKS